MEIKAAVLYERGGPFKMETVSLDAPQDDEVLVKVVGTGICHTDLVAKAGYIPSVPFPTVLGHEGAGVVEKVGKRVTKVAPGDHVAVSWRSCGVCPSCLAGNDPYCDAFFPMNFTGVRPDGSTTMKKDTKAVHGSFFAQSSFATHLLAAEKNVVPVPKEIPLEIVGPLGCGVQTGAGAVMNAMKVKPGSSIAVFGVGTVGMSAVMAARVCGCTRIIAVDVHDGRLELAKSLGATDVVNASAGNVVESIREMTNGGVDYSLECVGNPSVFRNAVDVLGMLGLCGLVGVIPPGTEVSLNMELILNGRRIMGIIEGDAIPDLFIPKLLDLYKQNRFPFDRLITYYPFDRIQDAINDMEAGRVIKPVLKP